MKHGKFPSVRRKMTELDKYPKLATGLERLFQKNQILSSAKKLFLVTKYN